MHVRAASTALAFLRLPAFATAVIALVAMSLRRGNSQSMGLHKFSTHPVSSPRICHRPCPPAPSYLRHSSDSSRSHKLAAKKQSVYGSFTNLVPTGSLIHPFSQQQGAQNVAGMKSIFRKYRQ